MTFTIEIDCPPGPVRAEQKFADMCESCELDSTQFTIISKSFGNWEWRVEENYEEVYQSKQRLVEAHLTKLFNSGQIRYASW